MAINEQNKWFPCHKVLPLIFDESLSYYEMVCKLIKMVEDIQVNSGVLSPEDREELNNLKQIAQNADNVYEGALLGKTSLQPFVSRLSELIEDTNHRTVTDVEKTMWSGKQNKAKTQEITLSVSDWNSSTTCTKAVTGVTATNIVIVDTSNGNVECTGQGNGTLTFTATSTPTSAVTVKVVIL